VSDRTPPSGLHVSISQLKAYLRCPRAYELRYVRGEQPEFVPEPLAFGRSFHAALACYYEGIRAQGAAPALAELEDAFRNEWRQICDGPISVLQDEEGADPVDQAVAMLGTFHRAQSQLPLPHVVAVEQAFLVDLRDPESGEVLDEALLGYLDLIIEESGATVIVEHKSSARRWSQDQLDHDIQPTAYLYAAQELGFGNPRARLQVATKTKVPALQVEELTRSGADIRDFLEVVRGVLRSIDQGISFPVRSWACRTCPYASACAARSASVGFSGHG